MKMRLVMRRTQPDANGVCVEKEYITRDIEVDKEFKSLRARGFGVIGAEWLE